MGFIETILGKKPEQAKSVARRRSTFDPSKTLSALRSIASKHDKKLRADVLTSLEDNIKHPSKPKPQPPATPIVSFSSSLPIRVTPKAKVRLQELLGSVRKNETRMIVFPSDVKSGGNIYCVDSASKNPEEKQLIGISKIGHAEVSNDPEKLGITDTGILVRTSDQDEKLLEFIITVPALPAVLRSQRGKDEGGLTRRLAKSRAIKDKERESKIRKIPNRDSNQITLEDLSTDLSRIDEGARVLSPDNTAARSLFQSAEELDNVAWVDFSEIRYFLEPGPSLQIFPRPRVTLTAEEVSMLREIDSAGGDSRNYQEQFYYPFKEAVANGVRDHMLSYGYWFGNYYNSGEGWTVTNDPETGTIHGEYDPAINPPTGSPGHKENWTINLKSIVDQLTLRLPYEDLADIADSYFSVFFLSTSDFWAARRAFFDKIRLHFCEGYDLYKLTYIYNGLNGSAAYASAYAENIGEIWAKLKENLLAEFGVGTEELGALGDEFEFHPDPPPADYAFQVFPTGGINNGGVNLGLRLVYRQEWRPLGIQRGEVVRTIPLGPKQNEKVSTRIQKRNKVTRTSESLKSTETSTEMSDTTKDSGEIINEASSAMKWNVNQEVEGGFNCGVWNIGGKTSGGISGESAQSSKETSTHLSETMQKIANRMRTETKVVVSTESETTFETTSATEIQNPNDEIAVTYVFSKLQRQYEILTRLAEAQNVVLVAESLPRPAEIDFNWVKQHDWIIAQALLDDSFRDALSSISQEVQQPDLKPLTSDLLRARDETIKHLGTFASTSSVSATSIDFAEESQKSYSGTAKEQLERLRQTYLLEAKRNRLYEHIRENILYYHRAIWEHEDPQQRLLRYRKERKTIPLDWWFQPALGQQMSIEEFAALFGANSESGVPGKFIADMNGRTLLLTDLINPAGPISYFGNYAIYYLRPEYAGDSDLMRLLKVFQSPYAYKGELLDPLQQKYAEQWDTTPPADTTIDECRADMLSLLPALQDKYTEAKAKTDSGADPNAVANFLANYQVFKESFAEYRVAKIRSCWEDMIDHVPELRMKYLQALKAQSQSEPGTPALELLGVEVFAEFYPEYKFRKEQVRRFLVDTNCLMIDLLPGDGSALEPFKQMHRAIDVLKANEERVKMVWENKRREKLLDEDKLGDPDIERVVVVSGNHDPLTALAATTDDDRPLVAKAKASP